MSICDDCEFSDTDQKQIKVGGQLRLQDGSLYSITLVAEFKVVGWQNPCNMCEAHLVCSC